MKAVPVILCFLLAASTPLLGQDLAKVKNKITHQRKRFDIGDPVDRKNLLELVLVEFENSKSGSSKYKIGKKIRQLFQTLESPDSFERDRLIAALEIAEIVDALQNRSRSPMPTRIDFAFNFPFIILDYLHNPIAKGGDIAKNLVWGDYARDDLSRLDPMDSSFWRKPFDLASQDTFFGFGRSRLPQIDNANCRFHEPKSSLGSNPGFTIKCGTHEVKVKFAEEKGEAFAGRIFHLLGYNVEPVDFSEEVPLPHSRALFQEFNNRKPPVTQLSLAGIPIKKLPIFGYENPLNFIKRVVLKDGTVLNSQQFATALLKKYDQKLPDFSNSNVNSNFESSIERVVFRQANIQFKTSDASVGPWDWNRLNHGKRRELRGAAVLAGWINWYDSRFDNNRLKVSSTKEGLQLKHIISDLGSVLGVAKKFWNSTDSNANLFPWSFTKSTGQGKRRKLGFDGFSLPYDDNDAFKQMTFEDAKWMARLIGQISEKQIREALVASGYSSAEVLLFLEKLVGRRDKLIEDVGLTDEFELFRPNGPEKNLNYNPEFAGPVVVEIGGRQYSAPIRDEKLINGTLIVDREIQ